MKPRDHLVLVTLEAKKRNPPKREVKETKVELHNKFCRKRFYESLRVGGMQCRLLSLAI